MIKILVTVAATLLSFSSSKPPHNLDCVYQIAINGTFFCTKTGYLASLVWWDGKQLGEFPISATKVRGGLVCYPNGVVEAGYFQVSKGKLTFNGKEITYKDVKWAITGGGLFLLDGKVVTSVGKKENLSSYIINHRSYSFILVHKDRRTVSLGVSKNGIPPAALAKRYAGKYYALLRLDGGDETTYFANRKKPRGINNCIGVAKH